MQRNTRINWIQVKIVSEMIFTTLNPRIKLNRFIRSLYIKVNNTQMITWQILLYWKNLLIERNLMTQSIFYSFYPKKNRILGKLKPWNPYVFSSINKKNTIKPF